MTEAPAADEARPVALTFHIDGDVSDHREEFAGLAEVASVDRVSTSQNRGIDVQTVITTMMTITTIASNASTMTATINNLILDLKKLAHTCGWKISVEIGRHKVDVNDVTPEQQVQLIE